MLLFSFLIYLTACSEGPLDEENQDDNPTNIGVESVHGPITLKLESVTAATALFTGSLDMNTAMLYTELGIIYSTNPALSQNNGTRLKIASIINDNKFIELISGLPHSTEIYYAPYYCTASGLFVAGEAKILKTVKPEINIVVDETSVTGRSVNLLLSVSGLTPADLQSLNVGIIYSDNKNTVREGKVIEIQEIVQEGNTIVPLDDLLASTPYYYCSYIEQNGNRLLGDIKEFRLPDPYIAAQKELDMSAAVNLSTTKTANCYIVSQAGLYKFRTVKGNSSTSVGNVASCSILWETFGTYDAPKPLELISAVCYRDNFIAFKTADTFKEGNALIAAKDASGKILWSWHIWLTDKPKGQVYYNNAGTMMDRNLGAGAPENAGLFYQWGRKDPFVGRYGPYSTPQNTTTKLPIAVEADASHGTIEYTIANPTTFILNGYGTSDWLYDSSSVHQRWRSAKTIYDPCPVGWRVPDGGEHGVWAKASRQTSKFDIDEENVFTGVFGDDYIYYPYTGGDAYTRYNEEYYNEYYNETKAYIPGVNELGYYWSCSVMEDAYKVPYSFQIEAYGRYYAGGPYYHMVNPVCYNYYSSALAVRCQKE